MTTQSKFRQTVENAPWEDIPSLKKHLGSFYNPGLDIRVINAHPSAVATGGAGADVEFYDKVGTAISNIGKTGIVCELLCTADDAYYEDAVFTYVWKTTAGVTTTSTVTGTATMLTTSLAMVPAIADHYCAVSLTSSIPTQAGETVSVHTTGTEATIWATIAAASSAALETAMWGTGSVYGRYSADHASHNAETDVATLYYITPWGEKKGPATFTTAADSVTEAAFINAAGIYVKDFYRTRELTITVVPDGAQTFLLTDANCANINGSGNDVWGMIDAPYLESLHTRHMCGRAVTDNFRTFLCGFTDAQYLITAEHAYIKVTYTPKDGNEVEYISPIINGVESSVVTKDIESFNWLPTPIELEPLSEVFIEAYDDAGTGANMELGNFIIIESEPKR